MSNTFKLQVLLFKCLFNAFSLVSSTILGKILLIFFDAIRRNTHPLAISWPVAAFHYRAYISTYVTKLTRIRNCRMQTFVSFFRHYSWNQHISFLFVAIPSLNMPLPLNDQYLFMCHTRLRVSTWIETS